MSAARSEDGCGPPEKRGRKLVTLSVGSPRAFARPLRSDLGGIPPRDTLT